MTIAVGSTRTSAILVAAALSLGCTVNTQGLTEKTVGDGSAQAGLPSQSDAHGADLPLNTPLDQRRDEPAIILDDALPALDGSPPLEDAPLEVTAWIPDSSIPQDVSAGDSKDALTEAPSSDVGVEAGGCVLPSGATICCASRPCTDHGGLCGAPNFCQSCEATCTHPARPVCCAMKGGAVTCEARPSDC